MNHSAARGDAEIRLEVAVMIPAEGGDALAGLDAELRKSDRELLSPRDHVAVRVTEEGFVGQFADDLHRTEERFRALENRWDGEGVVHREGGHPRSSGG